MAITLPHKLGSNATTDEIIGHVRHHYPELGPVLNQLLEKFENQEDNEAIIRGLEEQSHTDEENIAKLKNDIEDLESDRLPKSCKCPHCGSTVEFSSPIK